MPTRTSRRTPTRPGMPRVVSRAPTRRPRFGRAIGRALRWEEDAQDQQGCFPWAAEFRASHFFQSCQLSTFGPRSDPRHHGLRRPAAARVLPVVSWGEPDEFGADLPKPVGRNGVVRELVGRLWCAVREVLA